MDGKNKHAQELRKIPSEKRRAASKENGKKGGRPKQNKIINSTN